MKKIILTLGLSTLLTMSSLSASDLTISEPLAKEPLTIENSFKGFYIEPFFGGWRLSGKQNDGVSSTEVSVQKLDMDFANAYYAIQAKLGYVVGIAIGKHLSDYIGIESSLGYYHSNNLGFVLAERCTPTNNGQSGIVSYNVDTNYLGIINAILSPVINANITEDISLYFTAGIGVSYIMFSNNINNWNTNNTCQTFNDLKIESAEYDAVEVKHYNNAQKFHLSWAVGAGVRIHLTESTELDIGYSYKSLGKLPTSHYYQLRAKRYGVSVLDSMPLLVHEVCLGIKFNF